jgi:hypothetical protein
MNPYRRVLDHLNLNTDSQGDWAMTRLMLEALATHDTTPAAAGANPFRVTLDRLRTYGGHGFARLEQLLNSGAIAFDSVR